MQVVILAGGMGTRVATVAGGVPKALLPVAGAPFIEHQFALLRRSGLRDVLLCIGHLGDQLRRHVGDGSRWGMAVRYSEEDPAHLRGTGGALVQALPLLQDAFMLLYGDSYLPVDYAEIARAFQRSGCPALMCVYRNAGAWDASNTRIADGRVVYYDKRAPRGTVDYIDYGLSAFARRVVERYAEHAAPLDLARILGDLVQRGELAACEVRERFYEIGKPEGLAELDAHLRAQRAVEPTP